MNFILIHRCFSCVTKNTPVSLIEFTPEHKALKGIIGCILISACRSMVTDKSWNMIGLSKPQGSTTLISTIMAHIEREMENAMKNDCYSTLELSFQVLENCSRVTECRSLIVKGPLFACFENYCQKLSKKGIHCSHVIELWYNFFTIFTSYQEGQTALLKVSRFSFQCLGKVCSSRSFDGLRFSNSIDDSIIGM